MPSVLVTGASRGIGLAIATCDMSDRGWHVHATAGQPPTLATSTACRAVHPIQLDITDRSVVASLPEHLPPALDGVVNNAGLILQGPVEGTSLDDLSLELDVNVTSQIVVTQAVLPQIREAPHGRLVFISSVSGLITLLGHRRVQRIEVRP